MACSPLLKGDFSLSLSENVTLFRFTEIVIPRSFSCQPITFPLAMTQHSLVIMSQRENRSHTYPPILTVLGSARPEMVIFPNLFVGRKKLRAFIFLRKKIIIISGQTLFILIFSCNLIFTLYFNELFVFS